MLHRVFQTNNLVNAFSTNIKYSLKNSVQSLKLFMLLLPPGREIEIFEMEIFFRTRRGKKFVKTREIYILQK